MAPTEHEIRKLAAIAAAEQAVASACAGMLRLRLPEQPDLRNAELQNIELAAGLALQQIPSVPIPGLAAAEQHLVDDLYREAVEAALHRMMAELRK